MDAQSTTKAAHTPGPWRVNLDGDWVAGPDPYAAVICDIVPRDADSFTEEDVANAHLIAAAPDLLEALKNFENDDGHIPDTIWEARNAAIARAEGRSA